MAFPRRWTSPFGSWWPGLRGAGSIMCGRGFIFSGPRRLDGIVAAIVRELGLLGNVFKSAIYLFVVGKPCAVIRGSAHPTSVAKLTHSETGAAAGGFHLGSFLRE